MPRWPFTVRWVRVCWSSREAAIAAAYEEFDGGAFLADKLAERSGGGALVSTESQNPQRLPELTSYLEDHFRPRLEALGYACVVLPNPVAGAGPFLFAERIEDTALATVLTYGHGDVIRGQEDRWRAGLDPWTVTVEGDKVYGRGTADNKGQHLINLRALANVLAGRGRLGFNSKFLIETGEEVGSPGLAELFHQEKARLKADVLIASDGPRLQPDRPTLFLGSRGSLKFSLEPQASRRVAPFGQLGRPPRQSRSHPRPCHRHDRRSPRPDPGP
jgi:acetylornithine deacetylase/succinyl-diaminopimelate desuccinylase-like protein